MSYTLIVKSVESYEINDCICMNFSKDNEAVRNIAKLATGIEGSDKNGGKKTLSSPRAMSAEAFFTQGLFLQFSKVFHVEFKLHLCYNPPDEADYPD